MVKVDFYQTNKDADPVIEAAGNRLLFYAPRPTIIQPSETIKISMGLGLKINANHVLIINTADELSADACELFPSTKIIDGQEEVILAVRNKGRNQVNIMTGKLIAVGYLLSIKKIELNKSEPTESPKQQPHKTKPQKKNNFEFEVK